MQDTKYGERVCKGLKIKKLGEYHDFSVQKATLLLADVFEYFQNIYIEIYELYHVGFLTASGLAWHATLKITKVKLDLSSDIDK